MSKFSILILTILVIIYVNGIKSTKYNEFMKQSRNNISSLEKSGRLISENYYFDAKKIKRNHNERVSSAHAHHKRRSSVHQSIGKSPRYEPSDPEESKYLAGIARYILRNFDWGVMGSISTRDDTLGIPYTAVKSVAEGDKDTSTGQPYFYMWPKDFSVEDLRQDPRMTFTMSLDSQGYCKSKGYDPQEPECHWIGFSGNFTEVPKDTEEYETAYGYLLEKHPHMEYWPSDHFVAKIDIFDIMIQGGTNGGELRCIPLDIYFNTEPDKGP